MGKASLTAQRPLLDGGEGELLPRIDDMELDTHDEQKISPTGANTSSLPPSGFPPNITTLDASKNKRKRKATLANQAVKSQWTIYQGEFELPVSPTPLETHRGEMCPSGLALLHPAADLLKVWATYGCSTKTGTPWTQEQMQAAVDRMMPSPTSGLRSKVKSRLAKLVAWDSIKDNPPVELKISPIAAIPHK